MGCVYICRNSVNGKCYVGKTVKTIKVRKAWHLAFAASGKGWCFHRAIRKYGQSAFTWDVLFTSDDAEELSKMEIRLIVEHNARRPGGYNLTDGGDGVVGRDPEATARIVAFHRGRKRSDETKQRISDAMTGNKIRLGARLSDETKKKISDSVTGFKHSDQAKAKISIYFKGKPKTAEQRAKMSKARKKWWDKKRAENLEAAKLHAAEQADMFREVGAK